MEIQKDRPPYVTFEVRAEEDREATLAAGIFTTKDVHYAIITPAGSKDRIERRVDEWLVNMRQQATEGRIPDEWVRAYGKAYEAWREDRVIPEDGHPLVNWPVASPSQVKSLLDLRIRTVEDLASANEETLNRIGMGSRMLKQRAVDWLAAAQPGQLAAEMAKLRQDLDALMTRNTSLEEQNRQLKAQVATTPDTGKVPQKL